jgi:hypothetical protein
VRVRHLVSSEGVEWTVRKLVRERPGGAGRRRRGLAVLWAPNRATVEAPPDWEELSDAELLELMAPAGERM